jgi:hypothetical protein
MVSLAYGSIAGWRCTGSNSVKRGTRRSVRQRGELAERGDALDDEKAFRRRGPRRRAAAQMVEKGP